jgi:hypothetical protein
MGEHFAQRPRCQHIQTVGGANLQRGRRACPGPYRGSYISARRPYAQMNRLTLARLSGLIRRHLPESDLNERLS